MFGLFFSESGLGVGNACLLSRDVEIMGSRHLDYAAGTATINVVQPHPQRPEVMHSLSWFALQKLAFIRLKSPEAKIGLPTITSKIQYNHLIVPYLATTRSVPGDRLLFWGL